MKTHNDVIVQRLFLLVARLHDLLFALVNVKLDEIVAKDALEDAFNVVCELAQISANLTGRSMEEHRYDRRGVRYEHSNGSRVREASLCAIPFPSDTEAGRLLRELKPPFPCTGNYLLDISLLEACFGGYMAGRQELETKKTAACPFEESGGADLTSACALAWYAGRKWAVYGFMADMIDELTNMLATMGHPRHTLIQGGGG